MRSAKAIEQAVGLIGRERECSEIERLLESARGGQSASLVIRGEAGIGKSSLLEFAVGRAESMVVLRTTGVSSESDLAFAGLYGLLRPVIDVIDRIPEAQREALSVALGLAASSEPNRFLVSAAVLSLLAAAAEERPVVCLVDDAQWLDRPSADALVFVARRFQADSVAMLFAAREGEAQQFEAEGIPEMRVAGLEADDAMSLLQERAPGATSAVRARLLAEASGNPLALLELPEALTGDQLAGQEPLPEAMPLTPRLAGVFRVRVDRLPAGTQEALLVASLEGTGELATVLRALDVVALDQSYLGLAERAGLIRTNRGCIEFRHPLVRAAVQDGAALGERQRAHTALANVLVGEQHADRRVWHQAMAAVSGDEEVAAALEASARRAQRRAGHAAAATAYERAAELGGESRKAPRLVCAGEAAWDAGQADRARELIARALPLADGMLRARLLHLRGVIESRAGNLREAVGTLIEGADASADPSLTLEILPEAADAAANMGDRERVVELGARAARCSVRTARDKLSQTLVIGFAALFGGEYQRACRLFADALQLAERLDDASTQLWAAHAASWGFDLGAGLPFATRAVELARREGLISLLPIALDEQSMELFRNSSFDLAYAAAAECYQLSVDLGQARGWPLTTMARVEAVWGRESEARDHAEHALSLAQRSGEAGLAERARASLGLLELTIGRPEAAAGFFLQIVAAEAPDANPIRAMSVVPNAVEAVVRAGLSTELLGTAPTRYRDWVAEAPSDARRASLALCEALIGQRAAEEAFTEALELARALPPFERARIALLYGEWLRRERRRTDARTHLRSAAERFHSMGTIPWEERANAELRATGETARKRDPSTLDELTPQELQISQLVAEGMTNRKIAAQLYISHHTVEYHLRKVFAKLGITSRTELMRHGATSPRPALELPTAKKPRA